VTDIPEGATRVRIGATPKEFIPGVRFTEIVAELDLKPAR